jgi:hypothetical protein
MRSSRPATGIQIGDFASAFHQPQRQRRERRARGNFRANRSMMSKPEAVAALIEKAAKSVSAKTTGNRYAA